MLVAYSKTGVIIMNDFSFCVPECGKPCILLLSYLALNDFQIIAYHVRREIITCYICGQINLSSGALCPDSLLSGFVNIDYQSLDISLCQVQRNPKP